MDHLQPDPILQRGFMDPPWSFSAGTRLPGIAPVAVDDWIRLDDAFAGQMGLRDRLIASRRAQVLAMQQGAAEPAAELLEMTLNLLQNNPEYVFSTESVLRPDGVEIPIKGHPLEVLGRLVQEDFCILQQQQDEHALTAAILCFPASWTLSEKLGRSLIGVHEPVDEYDPNLAKRVQRLFDAIRPGRVLMRANCLKYKDFELFQPRSEYARREKSNLENAAYIRTERQCLIRLPQTNAVAFSIHTTIVDRNKLNRSDRAELDAFLTGKALSG